MAYPPSNPANNKADATATPTDHPAHHNALANAIIDIVTELGTSPKGSSADVTTRLGIMIANALVDAKGDLIAATADNTPARLAVGSDGAQLMADSSASTGLSYNASNPAARIGSLTVIGHSWNAGTALSATGTPAFENQGIMGRLCGLMGIHEDNLVPLGVSGSYLTRYQNFSFTGSPSPFSGWAGVYGFIVPNSSPLIGDTVTAILANPAVAPPSAYLMAHHINDMGIYGSSTTAINYALVENAWKHALRAVLSRCRAGALYSSYKDTAAATVWDSTLAFSSGTTTSLIGKCTGPAVRRHTEAAHNGATITFTIPTEVPAAFTVAFSFIGSSQNWFKSSTAMNNTDVTTAITITPANADVAVGDVMKNATTGSSELLKVTTVTDTTHITFTRGFNSTTKASHSSNDEFIKASNGNVTWTTSGSNTNISGAAAFTTVGQGIGGGLGDSSVAMVKRFACTSADAGKTIVATCAGLITGDTNSFIDFDSVWIESGQPPPIVVEKMPRYQFASPYLYVSAARQAALNTDSASVVAEFDSMVQIADVDTPFYSKSATLTNSALNNTTAGTITGITLDANGTDFAANVGTVITHNAEDMLVTAISGSYPSYTISVTRGHHSTTKVVHPSTTVVSDQGYMHTDNIHPNGLGHAVRAKVIYDTFNKILANSTAQQYNLPMAAGNNTQDQRRSVLAVADQNRLQPVINLWATTASKPAVNTLTAIPIYIPNWSIVTGMGVSISTANASATVRVGLYDQDWTTQRPNALIADFGSFSGSSTGAERGLTGLFKLLRPGWVWAAVAQQGTACTIRTVGASGLSYPYIPPDALTAGQTVVGVTRSAVDVSGALPSTFGTTVYETGAGAVAIPYLILRTKHYA